MKTLLTEKFSVAKSLAEEFSRKFRTTIKRADEGFYLEVRGDGFISGTLAITHAQGHLFEVDDETLLPKKWTLEDLPILIDRFKYKFRSDEAKKRFRLIKSVLDKTQELYVCTDPGREGELIARLILIHAKWSRWDRTYRIWTSKALTADVVYEEMKRRVSAEKFDSVYFSALARQHADFLVGINFTRAATLVFENSFKPGVNWQENTKGKEREKENPSRRVWSIGRVQTPVLRMIVERDLEVENFKKQKYYVVKAEFFDPASSFKYTGYLRRSDLTRGKADKNERPGFTEKEAKEIVEKLRFEPFGIIKSFDRSVEKEKPPELFSLTTLQKAANARFGFSAEKTHDIAQKLYQDYKVISYPRTEATGLPENAIPLVKEVLKNLGYSELAERVSAANYPGIFDPKKLTDHHAIIPLAVSLPQNALPEERKVFDLIVKRFVAAFMDPAEYEVVRIETELGGYPFKTRLKRELKPGWKEVYSEKDEKETRQDEDSEEARSKIPELKKGRPVINQGVFKEEKETKPPQRYTDGILISEMKRKNLGTPATRDGIIETLLKRGYVVREGKFIVSTEKGRFLVARVKDNVVSSPELTAQWEEELENIAKSSNADQVYWKYMTKIKELVTTGVNFFTNLKKGT